MSGVEAFNLACSVMQTIQFACDVTKLCKAIYQTGKVEPGLSENASLLGTVSLEMLKQYDAMTPKTAGEKNLVSVAEKCKKAANGLEEEVKFLQAGAKKGDLIATLCVAAKVTWRKRRLERFEKSLDDSRRTMETYLLVRVW